MYCVFVYACVSLLACFIFLHPNPRGCLLILATPWQQMERRSDRIRNHRERAIGRQVHEKEEPIASQPRGRQNSGNHECCNHRHGHEQPQENNIPIVEEVHEEGEDKVEQNARNDPVQGEEPPPTLAEVMDRQTRLLENLARR
jgi:hypothetical protein